MTPDEWVGLSILAVAALSMLIGLACVVVGARSDAR